MWHSLKEYFNTLEQQPLERLAFIVGSFLFYGSSKAPFLYYRSSIKKIKPGTQVSIFFLQSFHLIIHTGFGILIVFLSDWAAKEKFGLVYWFNASVLGHYYYFCFAP